MEVAVAALAILLLIAAAAWVVKLMLKPAVIITVFAVLGWLMWYSGLGQGGSTPNPDLFQQQMHQGLNGE